MTEKDSNQSTLAKVFGLLNSTGILDFMAVLGVDKYVKKLKTMTLIQMVALAQVMQLRSLRDISSILNREGLSRQLAIESISAGQISRRLRALPPEVTKVMFNTAKLNVANSSGMNAVAQSLGRLHLIDSSTITLCVTQYGWAKFRTTKAGVKVHLRLTFVDGDVMPDQVVVTNAKVSDKSQMDVLVVVDKDALNVFDRGYYDYKKYDHYCANGIRFVTRLKGNAVIEAVEDRPLNPGSPVKKDSIVYLGTPGKNRMEHRMRLLETTDSEGKTITILTNDFGLSAEEVCDIYRKRWQIELFFKWIKQHFFVKHLYAKSEQGVVNQLYIALLTYCLLLLIKLKTGCSGSMLTVQRLVCACMCDSYESFVQKLLRKPQRSSRGRRKKVDHDAIYRETMRQIIADEADYLNDSTYDPVIL